MLHCTIYITLPAGIWYHKSCCYSIPYVAGKFLGSRMSKDFYTIIIPINAHPCNCSWLHVMIWELKMSIHIKLEGTIHTPVPCNLWLYTNIHTCLPLFTAHTHYHVLTHVRTYVLVFHWNNHVNDIMIHYNIQYTVQLLALLCVPIVALLYKCIHCSNISIGYLYIRYYLVSKSTQLSNFLQ